MTSWSVFMGQPMTPFQVLVNARPKELVTAASKETVAPSATPDGGTPRNGCSPLEAKILNSKSPASPKPPRSLGGLFQYKVIDPPVLDVCLIFIAPGGPLVPVHNSN